MIRSASWRTEILYYKIRPEIELQKRQMLMENRRYA